MTGFDDATGDVEMGLGGGGHDEGVEGFTERNIEVGRGHGGWIRPGGAGEGIGV